MSARALANISPESNCSAVTVVILSCTFSLEILFMRSWPASFVYFHLGFAQVNTIIFHLYIYVQKLCSHMACGIQPPSPTIVTDSCTILGLFIGQEREVHNKSCEICHK